MSRLKIYRASAGSGKTYTLTENFIKLLFSNPSDYKHILAVTFTNKATAEMRSRILESLYKLSDATVCNPEYMEILKKNFSISESTVRERAALILYELLHDYSNFKVSTIDSFFQTIIRSFARETGLPASFRLELKQDQLLPRAVDNVMFEMDLPENAELKKWLVEYSESKLEEDKYWNVTHEILKICKLIDDEIFQKNYIELAQKLNNKKNLKKYKEQLQQIVNQIDEELNAIKLNALEIIDRRGLDIHYDFKGKSRSLVLIFKKMNSLNSFIEYKSYEKLIDKPEEWIRKETNRATQAAIMDAYNSGLNQLLHFTQSFIEQKSADYFTALAILQNLNALGIISDVNKKLNDICNEKNTFLLSRTNYLLNSIINNNETPFLYEKVGFRYSHFMIDEFQDTSLLQYKNFIPLIEESLSNNNFSLFTGDVKQAIYRWRNSNWNILAEDAEENFKKFGSDINVLNVNCRSKENIINFNNYFFVKAAAKLQREFNEYATQKERNTSWFQKLENKIGDVYSDVFQQVSPPKKDSEGYVHIRFFEGTKKDNNEKILTKTIAHIAFLLESGYKKTEICVLVRENKDAVQITNALLSGRYHPQNKELEVFSSDSLLLIAAESVKIVIAQLKFILNPNDFLVESFIRMALNKNNHLTNEGYDVSMLADTEDLENWNTYKQNLFEKAHLPLYELVESLVNTLPTYISDSDSMYIQSFLSIVHSFVNQENADLGFFIEHWEKNKDNLALSISENPDSITVMTIHKAKGLEFKSVVVPYFDWELKDISGNRGFIWVVPQTEPFNYLNIVPVINKKDLVYSHFSQDYLTETMSQFVDNLNLAYVAFTRAKESLSIFANIRKPKSENINTVADLLFLTISEDDMLLSPEEDEYLYQKGVIATSLESEEKPKKREETNIEIKFGKLYPMRDRIDFHLDSYDYFNEKSTNDIIIYGKKMHRIFEEIIIKADVDKSLNKLKQKGIINSSEISELKVFILDKINEPAISKWFDGSYEVKTETSIISKNDKRPDRVMIGENEVIVVDYKFGTVHTVENYMQVNEYKSLLSEMGYKNIKGYVWYVVLGDLIEV